MVFQFNISSVAFIYVELARYFLRNDVAFIRNVIDLFFKKYCDQREKGADAFIITHILLLMGYNFFS